jgi:hypothetical protein
MKRNNTTEGETMTHEETQLKEFTANYIEAALWSSVDSNDVPLDDDRDSEDIAPDTMATIKADCATFVEANGIPEYNDDRYSDAERAGHDFWLTRCGHGAGFWDGDWAEPWAEILTQGSKSYGEFDTYAGDDGRIYS